MYQTSEQFEELLMQESRTLIAKLSVNGTALTGTIKSVTVTGGSNTESDFAIGGTVSQYIDVTMADPGIAVEGKELLLQIGMLVDGVEEMVPMGLFTAVKPKTSESSVSFTAYDRMLKMEKPYFSSLATSTTSVAVLQEIATKTGVGIRTSGLSAFSMSKPVGYTCREVLSYIAQMYGGFAVCNRTGEIEIRTYSNPQYFIRPNRYWGPFDHNDYLFKLDQMSCVTGKGENGEDVVLTAGSGARQVTFSNPFMTQQALNAAWTTVQKLEYMPGQIRFLGDPRIDPWDMITVVDLNEQFYVVPVMQITQSFDGGLTTEVTAGGESESEQSLDYRGPQTKEMDRYYAQLVSINHALINKLDVDTARIVYASIDELDARTAQINDAIIQKADITELNAAVATINEAMIGKADITDLNAANANIVNLQAAYGNIETLLSGNAGIGDLQTIQLTAQNTVISSALIKSAVATNITVNDLLAGDIDTSKFRVMSPNGAMVIEDATQIFKDKDGNVRIQMGQDATGNFTFVLYDATGQGILLDSTGIKDSAVSDGLIKDRMVAANANIQASKLDIASLFTAMNDDGVNVLKGNKIWLDEENQTLNQAYSQMSDDIRTVGDNATAANTAANNAQQVAQAANDNAQKAIKALEGITSLDNLTAILTNDAHVVHTDFDGSGGNYTDAKTQVYVYKGDADVTSQAAVSVDEEKNVVGIWNPTTKVYQVTDLTDDDGYVDFTAAYGTSTGHFFMPDSKRLVMPDGKVIKFYSDTAKVHKRFSISKSPDGRSGASYSIIASAFVVSRNSEGLMTPASITFSAMYNDGLRASAYIGRFKIEESTDGSTWTQKYISTVAEDSKTYIPTNSAKFVRGSLYDLEDTLLDMQTVIIIADTGELSDEIATAKESIETIRNHVSEIETGVDGLAVRVGDTEETLRGVSDGTFLFQTPYTMTETSATFNAKLYKSGVDIHEEWPARFFSWYRKTEDGIENLGFGYTLTVNLEDMGYGGTVVARFCNFEEGLLKLPDGRYLKFPDGDRLKMYKEAA